MTDGLGLELCGYRWMDQADADYVHERTCTLAVGHPPPHIQVVRGSDDSIVTFRDLAEPETVAVGRQLLVELLAEWLRLSIEHDDDHTVCVPTDTWDELRGVVNDFGIALRPAELTAIVEPLADRWEQWNGWEGKGPKLGPAPWLKMTKEGDQP